MVSKIEKQGLLLKTTRGLLANNGVEGTSMEDIAIAANYTRRTLYSYFKSQQDVFMQVFIVDLENRWHLQKKSMKSIEGGLNKLQVWANTLFDFAKTNPQAMQLQAYWDYNGVNSEKIDPDTFERFKSLNTVIAEGLRAIFKEGIHEGSIDQTINIDMTISHFIYSHRAILQRALAPTYSFAEFKSDAYVEAFLKTFIDGIKTK